MATEERWVIASSGGDYTSLNAAWAAKADGRNLVTDDKFLVFECRSSSAAIDSPIAGGLDNITVDATRYIHILVPQAYRHAGVRDTGYRLETNGFEAALDIEVGFVRVEGVCFSVGTNGQSIILINSTLTTASSDIRISNCVFEGLSGWGFHGVDVDGGGAGSTVKIWNCIFDSIPHIAIHQHHADQTVSAYHCTAAKCASVAGFEGAFHQSAGTFRVKNCIAAEAGVAFGSTNDGFVGTFTAADFNLSSDASAPTGNEQRNKTVTFVNQTNNDFHLSTSDTVAKNISTANLNADATIAVLNDVDGQTYPTTGNVSIGADQIVVVTLSPLAHGSGEGDIYLAEPVMVGI